MRSSACGIARSIAPSSSLTAIRSAWKVRFEGLPPVRRVAAGMLSFTKAASSVVEFSGAIARALTIFSTIRVANFSSP